jgi:DUF1680 family protein
LDGYISRIAAAAAKDPDGYLNTYTQLMEPGHRWGLNGGLQLWQHDVYNLGALVDGVHHYRATGKTTLLVVGIKIANHMYDLMGPAPKKNIVPCHPLPEEALVGLYELFREQPLLKTKVSLPVNETNYLSLAEFWIENRGNNIGDRIGKRIRTNGLQANAHHWRSGCICRPGKVRASITHCPMTHT